MEAVGAGAAGVRPAPGVRPHAVASAHGRAVQVGPIKPKLKPPGTKHLKLKCDILVSTSAVKFNLRRYNMDSYGDYGVGDGGAGASAGVDLPFAYGRQGLTLVHFSAQLERLVWDRGCA